MQSCQASSHKERVWGLVCFMSKRVVSQSDCSSHMQLCIVIRLTWQPLNLQYRLCFLAPQISNIWYKGSTPQNSYDSHAIQSHAAIMNIQTSLDPAFLLRSKNKITRCLTCCKLISNVCRATGGTVKHFLLLDAIIYQYRVVLSSQSLCSLPLWSFSFQLFF